MDNRRRLWLKKFKKEFLMLYGALFAMWLVLTLIFLLIGAKPYLLYMIPASFLVFFWMIPFPFAPRRVYEDAKMLGVYTPLLWALIAGIVPILGMVVYLFARLSFINPDDEPEKTDLNEFRADIADIPARSRTAGRSRPRKELPIDEYGQIKE